MCQRANLTPLTNRNPITGNLSRLPRLFSSNNLAELGKVPVTILPKHNLGVYGSWAKGVDIAGGCLGGRAFCTSDRAFFNTRVGSRAAGIQRSLHFKELQR